MPLGLLWHRKSPSSEAERKAVERVRREESAGMEDEEEKRPLVRMQMLGALRDLQGDLTHDLGVMKNEATRTTRVPELQP